MLAVVCPVCREPLAYDVDALLSSPAPSFTQVKHTDISIYVLYGQSFDTLGKINCSVHGFYHCWKCQVDKVTFVFSANQQCVIVLYAEEKLNTPMHCSLVTCC